MALMFGRGVRVRPLTGLLARIGLGVLVALPLCAAAQPVDDQTFANMVARWNAILDFSETLLEDPDLDPAGLSSLRENVERINELTIAARKEVEKELERQQRLLEALGPPPAETEPPEARVIAEKRAKLGAAVGLYDARLKQIKIISARARDIVRWIGDLEASFVSEILGKRSRSPLDPEVVMRGVQLMPGHLGEFGHSIRAGWRQAKLTDNTGKIIAALVTLVVGLAVIALARRWLVSRYGMAADIDTPSLSRRFAAILVEALSRMVLPVALIVTVTLTVVNQVQLPADLALNLEVLAGSAVEFVLITGLAKAALTSRRPQWRILSFTDDAAAGLERSVLLFAAGLLVVNVATVAVRPARDAVGSVQFLDFEASTEPAVLIATVSLVLLTVLAFNVLRRRNWQFRVETPEGESLERSAPMQVRILFNLARGTLLAGVLFYLAGYLNLGVFLASRTFLTLALVALALIAHGMAREGLRQVTSQDNAVGRWVISRLGLQNGTASRWTFWIVLLLDIVLIVALALILLITWGVPWTEIKPVFAVLLYGTEIGGHTFSLVNVGIALAAFVLIMFAVKLLQRVLSNRILVQTRLDIGVRDAVTAGVGYAGVVVAALVGLSLIGLEFGEIALVFGALSIGIGFGLQHVVNNFISGLILLVQRPIKAGDWIVVGSNQGYVKTVSVISTEITTFDNASVIVPNSQLMTTEVMNWTHRNRLGRVRVPVGVSYSSDPQQVKQILLQCAADNETVLSRPAPNVIFMNFGESSLDFELRVFIRDVDYTLAVASELRFAIKQALDEAGIEIPFPQRDVHMKPGPGGMTPSPT